MSEISRVSYALALAAALAAASCAGDPIAQSRRHLDRGDQYLAEGKAREAIIEYRNAVVLAPGMPVAHAKLGYGYLAVQEEENALGAFIRAGDLDPRLIDAQLRAANLLLRGQAYVDARTRARAVLQIDPGNVSALVILGNALAGLHNLEEALAANERAVELDPSHVGSRVNLGSLRLMSGELKEAEEAFRSAVATDSKSVEARIGLASFLWVGGRLADAEREFKTAHALNPADLEANRALAAFYVASGRAPEAEGYLRAFVNRTGTPSSKIALSDYYLELGRYAASLDILRALQAEMSDDVSLDLRIARVLNVSGKPDAAAADVEAILARHPGNATALAFKTHLLLRNGRRRDALAVAESAVATNARSVQAQFALGAAQRALGRFDEAKKTLTVVLGIDPYAVGALIELAQIHLAAREMETALGYAEKAVQISPSAIEPNLVVARVLSSRPEWSARGAAILRTLADRYPRSAEVQSELARAALSKGDRAGAMRAFERARELDRSALEPLVELVRLDVRSGDARSARHRVDQALASHTSSVELHLLAAELSLDSDLPVAERHLRRVIELDPINADSYQMLGSLYLRQGKAAEARAEFMALATRQPKLVEPPTMLGLLWGMEGNFVEAERWFQHALKADPRAAVAANNLAWLYAERGEKLDLALQLAQVAYSELPQNAEVKDTLGWVYYKKGLLGFAIKTLSDTVAMQPDNPLFHYHLGIAHAGNGEDARARASLERALKLDPNFPGAAAARQTLARLLY